ncbi:hypothetical protein SRHO_G00330390 [Serrasalmus rhombeus]
MSCPLCVGGRYSNPSRCGKQHVASQLLWQQCAQEKLQKRNTEDWLTVNGSRFGDPNGGEGPQTRNRQSKPLFNYSYIRY